MMNNQSPIHPLFVPVRLGPLTLANRIVMAPMSRARAADDDAAHELTATYYAQRAGAGLIVTEASPVAPTAITSPRAPGIHSPAQIAGWRLVTDAVHAAGSRILLQLWHAGRVSHPSAQPHGALPLAPSALAPEGTVNAGAGPVPYVTPRALDADEIPEIVAQFAAAAANARNAGFDGVEIHAGNGYLIDQFLRDGANRRTDAWGGPAANRMRLLHEVVRSVCSVWDRGRVGVRLTPATGLNGISDSDPQGLFEAVAESLNGHVGFLHVEETTERPFDWTAFRSRWRGVYIANSGYDHAKAMAAIDGGHADLVSFGRPFIANPDLVDRLRMGAPLNVPDHATIYGGGAVGYTDYPALDMTA